MFYMKERWNWYRNQIEPIGRIAEICFLSSFKFVLCGLCYNWTAWSQQNCISLTNKSDYFGLCSTPTVWICFLWCIPSKGKGRPLKAYFMMAKLHAVLANFELFKMSIRTIRTPRVRSRRRCNGYRLAGCLDG